MRRRAALGVSVFAASAVSAATLVGCSHPQVEPPAGERREGDASAMPAPTTDKPSGRVGPDAASDVVTTAAILERGPAPPRPGVKFPFPQNREISGCTYPANYRNSDVVAAYEKWKADTVTSQGAGGHLRIQRHESDLGLELHSTVSEGIGYGMMLAVYMDDHLLFDELWKYEQQWLDGNGLMDWYINAAGTGRIGGGAATDADEDMAWALVQADRQWGGSGTLAKPYIDLAKEQIQKIWDHEIFESKLARAGDTWGDWNNVNISYFAPSYYRVFAKVSGDDKWLDVLKTVYDTIDNALSATNGNQTNGLVPAWCTSDGVPRPAFDNAPTHYQYDSCRTPFRIGLDWCFAKEPRAQAYVAKTSSFFAGIGASKVADGYELNGTSKPANPGQGSAAFLGPAAVGAMSDRTYQPFLNEAYAAVATRKLMAGGAYYEDAWTVISLLMMTGNFVDFTEL
jgi:endo-1,4-beta-D-glucanase Y